MIFRQDRDREIDRARDPERGDGAFVRVFALIGG